MPALRTLPSESLPVLPRDYARGQPQRSTLGHLGDLGGKKFFVMDARTDTGQTDVTVEIVI